MIHNENQSIILINHLKMCCKISNKIKTNARVVEHKN